MELREAHRTTDFKQQAVVSYRVCSIYRKCLRVSDSLLFAFIVFTLVLFYLPKF